MGTKISDLTELAAGGLASGDFFAVVDTDAGTTKKLNADNVLDSLSVTSFVKTLLDDANSTAILTTLGLDTDLLTLDLPASTTISSFIKTLLDDATALAARTTLGTIGLDLFTGYVDRAKVIYKDADEIYVDPFRYHHSGTTDQMCYSDARLTFRIGPVGSNGDSSVAGVSQFHYLYLDDSAIVTASTNVITATELLNSTTAPTYSVTKHGWYNGSDRCIFAFYVDSGGNIEEFFHDGDFVSYADGYSDLSPTANSLFTDLTLTIPAVSTRASISVYHVFGNSTNVFAYVRTNGQSGSSGHRAGRLTSNTNENDTYLDIITDSSQVIEYKSGGGTNTVGIDTQGWYLPIGM